MLLVIFGAVQAALHYYARNVAAGAASEGVTAGSVVTGTNGDAAAAAAATQFISAAGSGMLNGTSVSVSRTATAITVTVTGHAIRLLPGLGIPTISQTVSGPIEATPQG